jgi:RNA polymerase sigma factor (sigma-70 family)
MAPVDTDPPTQPPFEPERQTDDSPSPDNWSPTEKALEKLLAAFSPDGNEAAKQYELARLKLIRYFERRPETATLAERHADEALDRAMRRIDEGKQISNLMAYLYKIASNIVNEVRKEDKIIREAVERMSTSIPIPPVEDEDDSRQRCFDQCLENLKKPERELILEYYQEDGHAKIVHHKMMAARLGIQLNALRIRVHRIRAKLEANVKKCVNQPA